MAQDLINNSLHVAGALSCQSFTPPASCIPDSAIPANAKIAASKLRHRHVINLELFGPTTSVAALTKWIKSVYGAAAEIVSFKAFIAVVATDVSRTISVDLQKSTGAGAFATVCSAVAGFTNGSAVRTGVAATLNSTSLVAGDILEIVVTVAGGAGSQATGLTVELVIDEDAL